MERQRPQLLRSRYNSERPKQPAVAHRQAPKPTLASYPVTQIEEKPEVAQLAAPSDKQRRQLTVALPSLSRRTALMLIGLLVLAAGLTLLVTQHDVNKNKQLFSSAAANSVQFPLYYPATLSKGLSLQPNSALFSTGVVTFNIYNKDANPLPVTEQAKPARFDFDSFYKNNFQVSQQFDTPVGRASIGKLQGINVCSLVTKNTWIIVTAPDSVATSNLPIICKGFQPLSD